jgi:hypothetical protein
MSGRFGSNNLRFVALWLLLGVAVAMSTATARAVETEPFSIEPVAPHSSNEFPQKIVDDLDPQGSLLFTYSNGLKVRICEFFWVKAAAAQDNAPRSDKRSYNSLKPGALVGVIHFLAEASDDYREDFHDRKLRPGYYTMRYASMPDTDTLDFLLLSPLNLDRDPSALSVKELLRLSRRASHAKQPAVLSLVPVDLRSNDFPDVKTNGQGTWTLQVKLHLTSGKDNLMQELALAVIVITPKKLEEGS